MDARGPAAKILFPAIASIVAACLFCGAASAGDNVRVVPLRSDGNGNRAWVEIESEGARTKATPFIATNEDNVRKIAGKIEASDNASIRLPGIQKLVDRARQALRGMKRPAATVPAGADAATSAPARTAAPAAQAAPGTPDTGVAAFPREARPEAAGHPEPSLGPPERAGATIRPPAAL